jgi:hypothetical protein
LKRQLKIPPDKTLSCLSEVEGSEIDAGFGAAGFGYLNQLWSGLYFEMQLKRPRLTKL